MLLHGLRRVAQCRRAVEIIGVGGRGGISGRHRAQPASRFLEQGLDADAGSARGRCALIAGGGAERVASTPVSYFEAMTWKENGCQ